MQTFCFDGNYKNGGGRGKCDVKRALQCKKKIIIHKECNKKHNNVLNLQEKNIVSTN